MKQFFFEKILQNSGWKSNVLISTDESGIIKSIEENTQNETAFNVRGFALPGFQNAHSHGFQYAMAGLAEVHKH